MSVKIVQNLTGWFLKNARDLPWRQNPDPYWVWLSEIMLQQTQVATVLPYFDRFLKAFPTVHALASANLDEVLKYWAGLGYYSRARNLHKGAQAISKRVNEGHGFPKNRDEWIEIPGVGEYTAGAICSIALNQREAIVDGNVVRVLSRIHAWEKLDLKKTQVWDEARKLVNQKSAEPRLLNQALMELGALICKPKNPDCAACPVQKQCSGKSAPERYPEPKKKTKWIKLSEEKWILTLRTEHETEVFLCRNSASGWRQDLWDFPDAGLGLTKAKLMGEFELKYVVTNHKLKRAHALYALTKDSALQLRVDGTWFSLSDLPAVPAPVKKALQKVGATFF